MPGRTPVDIDRVKQLLAQGLTQKQIVQRLGVAKSVVSCIANGKYRPVTANVSVVGSEKEIVSAAALFLLSIAGNGGNS